MTITRQTSKFKKRQSQPRPCHNGGGGRRESFSWDGRLVFDCRRLRERLFAQFSIRSGKPVVEVFIVKLGLWSRPVRRAGRDGRRLLSLRLVGKRATSLLLGLRLWSRRRWSMNLADGGRCRCWAGADSGLSMLKSRFHTVVPFVNSACMLRMKNWRRHSYATGWAKSLVM